jgi:hypothetical protein
MLLTVVMNRCFLLVLVLGLFLTSSGMGQEVIYLPSEELGWGNPYPGLGNVSPGSAHSFATIPSAVMLYANEPEYADLSPTVRSSELYLARFPNNRRTGPFQKINFNAFWGAPAGGSKGLGMTEFDLSAMFALPMPTPDSPLLITPKFETTFFDHKTLNIPTFYSTGLNVRWMRPIVKNKLMADLGFGAFYNGDFRANNSETARFLAHVAGMWVFNPRTKIIFGVVYTDRMDNFNVFPMAGLIWTPNDDVSVELIVPRMRLAQRVHWFGAAAGDEQSDWIYTAFEFASGSWGCDFTDFGYSGDGRVEYRDLRLLLGYERRTRFGATIGLELGYMFDRKMEFERFGNLNQRPSDTVFLRLRTSF